MRAKINNPKTNHQQQNVNLFKILSHGFAAHESIAIDDEIMKLQSFKSLIIKNRNGETAEFVWLKNSISENHKEDYFKEVINDLGVKVNYNANSVVIINGGAEQYLEVALKVDN